MFLKKLTHKKLNVYVRNFNINRMHLETLPRIQIVAKPFLVPTSNAFVLSLYKIWHKMDSVRLASERG